MVVSTLHRSAPLWHSLFREEGFHPWYYVGTRHCTWDRVDKREFGEVTCHDQVGLPIYHE